MISILKRYNWFLVKAVVFLTVVIPLGITTYELTIQGKESVVFLGSYPSALGFIVVVYYVILLMAGLIWVVVQLVSLMRLRNENIRYELLHLQSQVNPHFFFNILNNLYGLIAKEPKQAQELILKLSELMRYSIYEGEREAVRLKEEIEYLQNYVELHKMRYHRRIAVDFNCAVDEDQKVIPLLFIILLENAFKHGVENLREKAFVKVNITTSEDSIVFRVENNFDSSQNDEHTSGIGLKNLKRRLELTYPDKHQLLFSITENVYSVQLILKQL